MDIKEIIELGAQSEIKNHLIEYIKSVDFEKKEDIDKISNVIEEIKINRMKREEDKNSKFDSLTTLFNKKYTKDKINSYLKSQSNEDSHALVLIDIVNFGAINKSLGYMFGDYVLINLADSLKDIFYHSDIVGRIGGDEFIIFLKNIPSRELLIEKTKNIFNIFNNTYTGEDKNYQLSCKAGIALYPQDGLVFRDLFNAAHLALEEINETDTSNMYFASDTNNIKDKLKDNVNYYSNYKLTKTKVHGTKNFDNEMIAFAFDIMSRTSDTKSAINLLLCKVREQFHCDKVAIIERIVLGSEYHITYNCTTNGIGSIIEHKDSIVVEEFVEYLKYFDDNGVVCIDSLNQTDLMSLKRTILAPTTKAVLQCGIYDNNELTAVVNVEDNKVREWTKSERESLITLTKIISSYLLKMRTSETASKQLYLMKNYDSLTNLPTLHRFKSEVDTIMKNNPDTEYAILNIDIYQFKHMNEVLGFSTGDKILCDFSKFISDHYTYESISRISEDNFAMLIPMSKKDEYKDRFLFLCEQYSLVHKQLYPSTKFIVTSGIAPITDKYEISSAIDDANIARKTIKILTKSMCSFYDDSMKSQVLKELDISSNMEKALKDGEFIVYIQPKISLFNDTVVGGEALVRWKKSDSRLIPPSDFIPIFEKNGFIIQMDFYIYEEVFKCMKQWIEKGIQLVPISLNVSRLHLNQEDFVSEIKQLVEKYKIPYEYIELELTESIFVKDLDIAVQTMRQIRELGMKVSIDDFGSGYSSLNLLKNMTTDIIKLDKEFFSQGDQMKKEEKIIVSSIIGMAKELKLLVLSEGVETLDQSEFLKSVECDMAQGYLYAKPMPCNEFEDVLIHGLKK